MVIPRMQYGGRQGYDGPVETWKLLVTRPFYPLYVLNKLCATSIICLYCVFGKSEAEVWA